MTPALGLAALSALTTAQRPLVDPRELRSRVLHIGLGAFQRAHQAVYTEAATAAAGVGWGIAGVAPGSAATVEGLRAQDNLYSVTDLAPDGASTRVVAAFTEALRLQPDADRVRALFTSDDLTTVTLTITEKGYHRRGDTGGLDLTSAAIAEDLARTADDRSAHTVVGALAAGLVARYRAGGAPIDIVSCDNMTANGAATARAVREFLTASSFADRDAVLAWSQTSVGFPNTVVDRIVPTTTDDDRTAVAAALGVTDRIPVVGEPYRQWVLEDSFAAPRPAWELAGAGFVDDVAPYQLMKLRMLNGSHSAMAYLGLAAGCRTVADVLSTSWGEKLVRGLAAEVAPTLPGALDVPAYTDALVARFSNPSMRDQLRRIGCDGSLKVGERWFGVLRRLGASGAPVLTLALAGWVNATRPAADGGQWFGTTDPAGTALAENWRDADDPVAVVAALLRTAGADDLAGDAELVRTVAALLPAVQAGRIDLP
ncbi:mannitol dehydrogenase family protein [Nakamurella deserti]|uniref:mannitol dehydrogenase family protein n=1 Tax=Nakamurella deserti TaxID=2164074 RepID=UPI000DBEA647|nr:mannitol dehydrogenase family protein [Nakamurella deserti]